MLVSAPPSQNIRARTRDIHPVIKAQDANVKELLKNETGISLGHKAQNKH